MLGERSYSTDWVTVRRILCLHEYSSRCGRVQKGQDAEPRLEIEKSDLEFSFGDGQQANHHASPTALCSFEENGSYHSGHIAPLFRPRSAK
jgi:hypothetical protein